MPEPLTLSIITITYKDAAGLNDTVRSLRPLLKELPLGVTWEHIVVDSSPEENEAVLNPLERDARWPLERVKTPPHGVYPAINAGIEHSRGRYLWILNGGDRLASAAALVRALSEFQGESAPEMLATAVELRREDRFLYLQRPSANVHLGLLGFNRICHQGLLYNRDVFKRLGSYSTALKIAADYEHHVRCVAAGIAIRALPDTVLAIYDMSGRSNDYRAAFAEFRRVQRMWAPKLPLGLKLGNEIVRPLEFARIAAFKRLSASPLSTLLKPLWLKFKRWSSS